MKKDNKLIYTLNQKRHNVSNNNNYNDFCKEWDEIEKYHTEAKNNSKRVIKIVDKRNKPVEFHKHENPFAEEQKKTDERLLKKLNESIRNVKQENNKKDDTFNKIIDSSKLIIKKVEQQFDEPVCENRTDVLSEILKTLKEVSENLYLIKDLLIEK